VLLCLQILDLGIETESELDGVMRLVFEKAIAEPGFSVTYAQLCHKLSKVLSAHTIATTATGCDFTTPQLKYLP